MLAAMQSQDVFGGFGGRYGQPKFGADNTGFSHGAYNNNHTPNHGFGERNNRKSALYSLATAGNDQQTPYKAHDTPGGF